MAETTANSVHLSVDLAVYSMQAIQKAAYRLGDRCSVSLEMDGPSRVLVMLTPTGRDTEVAEIANSFQNEVLDQNLRELISKETSPIRDLILAQAFSAFSIIDSKGESASPSDDPIGIKEGQHEGAISSGGST